MEKTKSNAPSATHAVRTFELILRADPARHELLIAELDAFGFERFWQEEHRLRAYVPARQWEAATRTALEERLHALDVEEPFVFKGVSEKNWNVVWEKGLVPISAGPFVIKPTWAETPADCEPRFVLEIDPKMSFGTGHHESTRLALRLLAEADVPDGARVLDAGTGTAVLAIAAVRLGAASVVAFDTDERVLDNAAENLQRNDAVSQVELRAGILADTVSEEGFDLILANINRNALSEMMSAFREKLAPGGRVIMAGLLRSDRAPLLQRAAACGLALHAEKAENEWWSVMLKADHADA